MLAGWGLRLAADVGGPEHAPYAVLVPGAGQTRRAWAATAHRLSQTGYRVLSLDLRGHGGSDWAADGDYGIDAFVADIETVLASLAAPAVLVGASIGGIAALIAAAGSSAARVAGLVLVDVVPHMQPQGLQRIRDFMSAHADGFASLEEAADAVAAFLPDRPRPANSQGLLNSLRQCDDGRLRWHWDPAFHAGSAGRSGMFERMEAAAAKVVAPTLLISGKRSDVVSREGAQKLLSMIPHARWIDVEDAAHMVAGDSNEVFQAALEDFLQTLPPSSSSRFQRQQGRS
ncbi:MAG: alpha/beta hydrolase [Pseudomonas sp.]|uniref:alpha/beta fold hydrolase n=1 Tax=Pseudomonas sp. TaxID=306 RepID=UPI003981D825